MRAYDIIQPLLCRSWRPTGRVAPEQDDSLPVSGNKKGESEILKLKMRIKKLKYK